MSRTIVSVAVASAATGIAVISWTLAGGQSRSTSTGSGASTVSQPEGVRGLEVRDGTEKSVGVFQLDKGRKVRLLTADATDGKSCLIEEDTTSGSGSTCLENGLFEMRKVAFLVDSSGGPERFSELYLAGVAAPGIHAVSLRKTDGSTVDLQLTGERAFLFESPARELERDILPAELRLVGANGKLLETVAVPALR